ncbi:hypothetical protein HPB50_015424 [Hyalomma asiaticum]|uniref:Uncharacterized protein n=1 Tax=Hyalomma asiaticum TaxID=266040 RepID=A0ACB7SHF8_HYAAI|nr:hypothetical protein HPB50_015424 [Hyalomma asiaticum]
MSKAPEEAEPAARGVVRPEAGGKKDSSFDKDHKHHTPPDRPLYLSFDYCHVLKNIRNQFLDTRRIFRNDGVLIVPDYLRNLHDIQEKQARAFKLVRCLTKKHLWPSNFEKMSVSRAVAIFCPQVTTVLRFLQKHGQQLGFHGFEDCLPTIEFMELIHKWFTLHNIKSTSLFWRTRDALKMPFYGPDDERLTWLENEFLTYFESWKENTTHKLEFLSEETYEALRITTTSTVLCTRHLLGQGFHFVLTGKSSSDDVESLFSTTRQLNESNDQTDAYAALSSLHKILVTGCIHSFPSGNVGSVIGSIGEATKLAPEPASVATPEKDIKKLLLPHLTALERFPYSTIKYVHECFNLVEPGTPVFFSYRGTTFSDILGLLRNLLPSLPRLVLHVGTVDIVNNGCVQALADLKQLL